MWNAFPYRAEKNVKDQCFSLKCMSILNFWTKCGRISLSLLSRTLGERFTEHLVQQFYQTCGEGKLLSTTRAEIKMLFCRVDELEHLPAFHCCVISVVCLLSWFLLSQLQHGLINTFLWFVSQSVTLLLYGIFIAVCVSVADFPSLNVCWKCHWDRKYGTYL